jgi:predicted dehydrogenase
LIKIGIIGCGYWGPNYVRVFSELKNSYVKWVADIDKARLAYIKELYPQINITQDYNDILRDNETTAVVVSIPASKHFEVAKDCILGSKDLLVEKPFTLNVTDGKMLVRLAEARKTVLMVGHLFEYNPCVWKLKEYISNGELGKIYYMHFTRTGLGPIRHDASALWDLASHDVYIAQYLLDKTPIKVSATGKSYIQKNVDDIVFLTLEFPQKVLVHIHASWLDPHKVRAVTVIGDKKMAVFDDVSQTEKIKIFSKSIQKFPEPKNYGEFQLAIMNGEILIPKIDLSEPLKNQAQHFIDCIESRKRPNTDGTRGMKVVSVLEAAEKSIAKGGVPMIVKS